MTREQMLPGRDFYPRVVTRNVTFFPSTGTTSVPRAGGGSMLPGNKQTEQQ